MASALHNLSDYDFVSVPNAADMKFGIVVSEWNSKITGALLQGAFDTLTLHGAKEENIFVQTVPGSFELVFGSSAFVNSGKVDAVIAIGCVIKGDTPHFDYICQGTTQGLAELNARHGIFRNDHGVKTCDFHRPDLQHNGASRGEMWRYAWQQGR